MKILSIDIRKHNTIKSWQRVNFDENPLVFIGKNGSGKTSVLEALSAVFKGNAVNTYHYYDVLQVDYKIRIQLSQTDLAWLKGDVEYNEKNSTITVYCEPSKGDRGIKVNRIESVVCVDAIKAKQTELSKLATEYETWLRTYFDQINGKLSELGIEIKSIEPFISNFIYCVTETDANDKERLINLQNYLSGIKKKIEAVNQIAEEAIQGENCIDISKFSMRQYSREYSGYSRSYGGIEGDYSFRLRAYVGSRNSFEAKFISFDEAAMQAELDKINALTVGICEKIASTDKRIRGLLTDIVGFVDDAENRLDDANHRYETIIGKLRAEIGRRCFFLSSDNGVRNRDRQYSEGWIDRVENMQILEAYIRSHVEAEEQGTLLKELHENKLDLSKRQDLIDGLEKAINADKPAFEQEMYEKVQVTVEGGKLNMVLVENDGSLTNLYSTSAGRVWYFKYYFIKRCLRKGDIFIIDEPAAFLHPDGQSEVLSQLLELSQNGVTVIYSTHSPYLIPNNTSNIKIVSMDETTKIKDALFNETSFGKIRDEIGDCGANDFLLKMTKPLLLVEGESDKAFIRKFMEIFNIDSSGYNIYPCRGHAIIEILYFCINNNVQFKALLDLDNMFKSATFIERQMPNYSEYMTKIKRNNNCVFTPDIEGGKKSLENLLSAGDSW